MSSSLNLNSSRAYARILTSSFMLLVALCLLAVSKPVFAQAAPVVSNGNVEYKANVLHGGTQAGSAQYSVSPGGTGNAYGDSNGWFNSRFVVNATIDKNCPVGCGSQSATLAVEKNQNAYGSSYAEYGGSEGGSVYAASGTASMYDVTAGIRVIVPTMTTGTGTTIVGMTPAQATITQPVRGAMSNITPMGMGTAQAFRAQIGGMNR